MLGKNIKKTGASKEDGPKVNTEKIKYMFMSHHQTGQNQFNDFL
jgi:hypothetical protein